MLAIDTSSDVASLALAPVGEEYGLDGAELRWNAGRNQTVTLLAEIDHLCRLCGIEIERAQRGRRGDRPGQLQRAARRHERGEGARVRARHPDLRHRDAGRGSPWRGTLEAAGAGVRTGRPRPRRLRPTMPGAAAQLVQHGEMRHRDAGRAWLKD